VSNTIPHPTRRAYPHSSKGGNKVDPSQLLDQAQKIIDALHGLVKLIKCARTAQRRLFLLKVITDLPGEKKSRFPFQDGFIDSFMAADGAIGASPETQSALLEEDRTGGKYKRYIGL